MSSVVLSLLCLSGVSFSCCAGLPCVAHVGEMFPLEPEEGLLKWVASFQVSFLPKQLVISGVSHVPGKINIFQAIAVLFGGSRSWFNAGAQLWREFSNPALVAKQLPNVTFWSADVDKSFHCR